ncbi:MAG: glycerophosphodiester phosphodiesterase [Oscillospiraceae bacterium]|nr:glycerophosphodiester phosphodiesterase [Oscillospiraceae bacterium]
MMFLLIFVTILCILYVFALRCRKGHKGLQSLQGWAYAHRGLHGNGVPENSMQAFRLALEHGYGIELDVHLMADGELAVIHDPSLKRTAGVDVMIEDLTKADLVRYNLEGTDEKIPLFSEVLDLFSGKAPLIVELKAERNNHAALSEAVCKMMDSYQGAYCLESFDPRCVRWLRQNRPDQIRGQLTENFVANSKSKLPFVLKFILTKQLMNFLTLPDFIAYKSADRKRLGNFICRKLWGAQGVTWTIKTQEEFDDAVKGNWLPIFEGFRP